MCDITDRGQPEVDIPNSGRCKSIKQVTKQEEQGQAYVDNFGDAVDIYQGITTDLNYMRNYDSNKSASSATGSPKSFDNINADNFFEKPVGSIQGTATTIAKKIGGLYSLDKGPEGAFISGMISTALGGGFPLGTAAVWMAYGYQQEKDKNDQVSRT